MKKYTADLVFKWDFFAVNQHKLLNVYWIAKLFDELKA